VDGLDHVANVVVVLLLIVLGIFVRVMLHMAATVSLSATTNGIDLQASVTLRIRQAVSFTSSIGLDKNSLKTRSRYTE